MKNIQFLDRVDELKLAREIGKENFFLVVKGRRRIGKTTYLKKCFSDAVYIFIWPNKSIEWISEKICEEHSLPQFRGFVDILKYLLDNNKTIIIDEFQNFSSIDKSVYGEMQKLIDEKKGKFCKIAVAGSSYSLMNKVFDSFASPLYGRRTAEIFISHLPIHDLFNGLKLPLEEFVILWSVFEGVPYYYELIDSKMNATENIRRLLVLKNALLQNEGRVVLSVEFGEDSKTYNTVLMAIAEGKTKINEIASLFGNKSSEVVKYLDLLRKEFGLVRRLTPILASTKSKEGRYEIIDNFLDFWFYFVDRKRDYIEQERFNDVNNFFEENFNSFIGRKFEKFIIELIKNKIIKLGFRADSVGKQWGSAMYIPRDKNQYEIDIVALNERTKEILFGECKWKDDVNVLEVFNELNEKAGYVGWHKEKRKESYVVFAKSFRKKINEFEGKKVYCFDLKDIERELRNY